MSGSIPGAAFNLIVSIVGTGILSFPTAFSDTGILWSFLLLSGCTCFSYISLKLLIIASDALKTQFPDRNIAPSYPTLAMISGGRPLALFTQIVVLMSLWGSANTRILGAAQIIVRLAGSNFGVTDELQLDRIKMLSIMTFTVMIIFPLGLMRSMSSLRFTSLLSVICSIFLTVCLLVEYLRCGGTDTICFWTFNRQQINEYIIPYISFQDILNTIPIFIFGYNCHPSVFPIYKALVEDSDGKSDSSSMSLVFKGALTVSFTLYTIAGSSGFLLFQDETPGNILDHDHPGRPHLQIAKVLFAVAMILAVPTFVNAIRETCIDMVVIYRTEISSTDGDHERIPVEDPVSTTPSGEGTAGNTCIVGTNGNIDIAIESKVEQEHKLDSKLQLQVLEEAIEGIGGIGIGTSSMSLSRSCTVDIDDNLADIPILSPSRSQLIMNNNENHLIPAVLRETVSPSAVPRLRSILSPPSIRRNDSVRSLKSQLSIISVLSPKVLDSRLMACESLRAPSQPHAMFRFDSLRTLSRRSSIRSTKANKGNGGNGKSHDGEYRMTATSDGDIETPRSPLMMGNSKTDPKRVDVINAGSVLTVDHDVMNFKFNLSVGMQLSTAIDEEEEDDGMGIMVHTPTNIPINTKTGSDESDDEEVDGLKLGTLWHVIISCIICVILAAPAIAFNQIDAVFRVLGSTCNPMSGYILPTIFVLALVPKKEQRKMKMLAVFMSLVVGVVSVSALVQQFKDAL